MDWVYKWSWIILPYIIYIMWNHEKEVRLKKILIFCSGILMQMSIFFSIRELHGLDEICIFLSIASFIAYTIADRNKSYI